MSYLLKNILITTEDYYPVGGGIQQFIRGLAEFLTSEGFNVFIYTKNYPEIDLSGEHNCREGIVNYSHFMVGTMKKPFSAIKNKNEFVKYIKDKKIDLIFSNNHNSLAWIKAAQAAEVPVIYGCHGVGLMDPFKRRFLMPNDEISWGFPSVKQALRWLLLEDRKWWKSILVIFVFFLPFIKIESIKNYWRYKKSVNILNSADGRYGNSSITAKLFSNKNNTFGFPLGINASNKKMNHHYYKSVDSKLLEKFDLVDKKYILCPGRIHEIKGQKYAIEALLLLKDKKTKLVLAGNTSLFEGKRVEHNSHEKKLRELIIKNQLEDRVIFTGLLNFEEMRSLYSSALVSIVPSIWLETFGYVTIESMSCETPVIVTRNCGSAECVTKNSGFVIERKNKYQIAEIINNNSDKFLKMGISARKVVLNNYNWTTLGDKYIDMFNQVNNDFYEKDIRR